MPNKEHQPARQPPERNLTRPASAGPVAGVPGWDQGVMSVRESRPLTTRGVLQLQHTVGNQRTTQLLRAVQREEWDKDYGTRRTRPGALPYEEYKQRIGQKGESESFAPALKAASEWGGTKLSTVELTLNELSQILLPERPSEAAAHAGRLTTNLPNINAAFRTMQLDTVQSQADYLAHTAGESGTLTNLTEVGGEKRSYAPFQGRGPVQVTHREMYLQTLAYLDTRLQQLDTELAEKETQLREGQGQSPGDNTARLEQVVKKLREDQALLKEAATAIKGNQEEAANPKYAFIFSAAYMHMTRGVKNTAGLGANEQFPGNEAEDRWVTSHRNPFTKTLEEARERKDPAAISDMNSAIERAKIKRETYGRAYSVLSAKAKNNPAAAESTGPESSTQSPGPVTPGPYNPTEI